jgi:hypothetical protein
LFCWLALLAEHFKPFAFVFTEQRFPFAEPPPVARTLHHCAFPCESPFVVQVTGPLDSAEQYGPVSFSTEQV